MTHGTAAHCQAVVDAIAALILPSHPQPTPLCAKPSWTCHATERGHPISRLTPHHDPWYRSALPSRRGCDCRIDLALTPPTHPLVCQAELDVPCYGARSSNLQADTTP